MSGKAKSRSSGRQSAQTSTGKQSQSRLTSAATIKEDAPEYRVAAVGRPPQTSTATGDSQRRSAETPLRFIDLFCGIGGFRIAFERAGGQSMSGPHFSRRASTVQRKRLSVGRTTLATSRHARR